MLAPFANEVIALDETTLDQVSRRLPSLRHFKKGDPQLLPGKLVSLFDVRLQQWRAIEALASASENGREQARQLVSQVKKGALILADLGYFGFRWFDELTEAGYSWISRFKEDTTLVVLHTYYEAGETIDRLVWLGAWDCQAKYAVRQVQFRQGGVLRQYLTNVCDPTVLPLPEIARLYARRWDIELAFLTLKRELGLHLIWSSKSLVVQAQVWACLILAQVMQAIRMEVALRAEVDAFEVSLPILFETLPHWHWHERDGIDEWVRQGRRLGLIRPSTRLRVQAPQIEPAQLLPLPPGTILCRRPFYGKPKGSGKQKGLEPPNPAAIPPDPARDRVVTFLLQREAQLQALKRLARTTPLMQPKSVGLPRDLRPARPTTVLKRSPVVEPDPSIAPPSLAYLQPFFGLA
jgi:transposase